MGHFFIHFPSPKDIKKSMQITWSDTNSKKKSDSIAFEYVRYGQNDFLAFVASIDSMHGSYCEHTNEQNVIFLDNLVLEYQNLIKKYLRNQYILAADKVKIELLNEEMTNFLENFDFLSLNTILFLREIMFSLKRLKKLNLLLLLMRFFILEPMCLMKYLIHAKPMVIREVWGILIKLKLLLASRETIFVKGKEKTTSHATSFNIPSLCTNCKKFGHTQNRCHIKFL